MSETLSDQELIQRAKANDQDAIKKLFDKNRDLLEYKASAFKRVSVPFVAIQGEAYKLFMQAIKKYNPASGVMFRTFLESQVRLGRFVNQSKGIIRIPENKALKITEYRTTKESLEALFGREPTPTELADQMNMSVRQVTALEESLSRNVMAESGSFDRKYTVGDTKPNRFNELTEFAYYQLDHEEKHVFDYYYGKHGKPKSTVESIAKKLNISTDKVYRTINKISKLVHGR